MNVNRIPVGNGALVASRVISTKGNKLHFLYGRNTSASDRYIQIFNATSLPADGAVPSVPAILVPAGEHYSFSPPGGIDLDRGIVVCTSSTEATKTVAAAEATICGVIGPLK
jgi:hypothetical protein